MGGGFFEDFGEAETDDESLLETLGEEIGGAGAGLSSEDVVARYLSHTGSLTRGEQAHLLGELLEATAPSRGAPATRPSPAPSRPAPGSQPTAARPGQPGRGTRRGGMDFAT